jgi:hypothetical protein
MSLDISIIEHIRRVAEAIAQGRIEARQVADMTDDQLAEYSARLTAELDDAIAEGESKSGTE